MEIRDIVTDVGGLRKLLDYVHSKDNQLQKPHPEQVTWFFI